ncbi:MAG TPA: hypothetical protein VN107_11990, partial [Microbacterium sp.]|nr:hypothetical protein [Microbacterium sp.]
MRLLAHGARGATRAHQRTDPRAAVREHDRDVRGVLVQQLHGGQRVDDVVRQEHDDVGGRAALRARVAALHPARHGHPVQRLREVRGIRAREDPWDAK